MIADSQWWWQRVAIGSFVSWLLYSGAVSSEVAYLAYERDLSLSRVILFVQQLVRFGPLFLSIPLVFRLGWTRKLPGPRASNLGLHLALAFLILLSYTMTSAVWERGHPLRSVPQLVGFADSYLRLLPGRVVSILVLCAPVYGLARLDYYAVASRQQSMKAMELQSALGKAQLELLQNQLRPHFLFNTLNTVSALVEDDPARARSLLAALADMFRVSLEHQSRARVKLSEELRVARLYLSIQQTRFGDRLEWRQQLDVTNLSALVPSFLLQPLLENAIRHAVERSSAPCKIELAVIQAAEEMTVRVRNPAPKPRPAQSQPGVGLDNLRKRLEALYGARASLRAELLPTGVFETQITVPIEDDE